MLPVTVMIWCWSEHQNQSCWECMPISCPACRACQTQMVSRSAYPACQAGRAKTGNETSARREIWDQSLATILDKIKWNSKSPSPQIKDEGARRAKTRHFPILDLGGSGGGGGSRFSIYFVQDCRSVLGGEGMTSFFPCLWDVISKYQWSL